MKGTIMDATKGNTEDKSDAAIEAVSKINVALLPVYSAIEQADAESERIPEDISNAIDRIFSGIKQFDQALGDTEWIDLV
jgi:thiamine biosynthesis protein ThiC